MLQNKQRFIGKHSAMGGFIALGIVSSVFQLVLLREFIFSIAKNELSFIVAVGAWLLFCSLGSLLGIRKKIMADYLMPFVFSAVFCVSVAAIHCAKTIIGSSYYEASSIVFVAGSSLLLIGPVALTVGYCFARQSTLNSGADTLTDEPAALFFAYEAIGFLTGGIGFAFFASDYANPFYFAFLPLLFLFTVERAKIKKLLAAVAVALCAAVFVSGHTALLKQELDQAEILLVKGSRYGPVVIARKFGVTSLYLAGTLVASSEDTESNEAFIHTSLSSHPGPKQLLYIGTLYSGEVAELLKYPLERIDSVELNPVLAVLGAQRLSAEKSKRVSVIIDDPRVFLKDSSARYDYIVMSMPAPSSIAYNRYFTYEFFELIKARLEPGGVFSFHIPSKRDIISPGFLRFNSSVINALMTVFPHVLLVPSDSMTVIASPDRVLSGEAMLVQYRQRGISAEYFTEYHLQDLLDPARLDSMKTVIDTTVTANQDYNHRGFLYYLLLEQAKFYPWLRFNVRRTGVLVMVSFIAAALLVCLLTVINKRIFVFFTAASAGFLSISMTTATFVLFQLFSGALYWKAGILIGIFMGSVSLAVFLANRKRTTHLKNFSLPYACWLGLFLSLYILTVRFPYFLYADGLFYLYAFASGMATGAFYPLLTRSLQESLPTRQGVASLIYAADLAGACLGTLCCSLLLIPFLGIQFGLVVLIAASAIMGLRCLFG